MTGERDARTRIQMHVDYFIVRGLTVDEVTSKLAIQRVQRALWKVRDEFGKHFAVNPEFVQWPVECPPQSPQKDRFRYDS